MLFLRLCLVGVVAVKSFVINHQNNHEMVFNDERLDLDDPLSVSMPSAESDDSDFEISSFESKLDRLDLDKEEESDVKIDEIETDSPNHATTTLLELIYNTPDLSIFSKLVRERPVIADILSSEDQDLTLFAPSDSAFRGGRNPEVRFDVITQLVMYHLVDGERLSQGFQDGELLDSSLELESLGGDEQKIKVSVSDVDKEGAAIKLNGHVRVKEADLKTSNGIAHITDKLLIPPPNLFWMLGHSFRQYAAFAMALKATSLDVLIKKSYSTTLWAPDNAAFKKLGVKRLAYLFSPAGRSELTLLLLGHISPVLLYHQDILVHPLPGLVVPTLGKPISVVVGKDASVVVNDGEASLISFDLIANNGVIHGIDNVLGENWSIDNDVNDSSDSDVEEENPQQSMETEESEQDVIERVKSKKWYRVIFEKDFSMIKKKSLVLAGKAKVDSNK